MTVAKQVSRDNDDELLRDAFIMTAKERNEGLYLQDDWCDSSAMQSMSM